MSFIRNFLVIFIWRIRKKKSDFILIQIRVRIGRNRDRFDSIRSESSTWSTKPGASAVHQRLLLSTAQMRRRLWFVHRVLTFRYVSRAGRLIESSHAMRTLNVVLVLGCWRRWQVRQIAAFLFHFARHFSVPNSRHKLLVLLSPVVGSWLESRFRIYFSLLFKARLT